MSIENIKDLRDHALHTLAKLDGGIIDTKEALAASKIYQSILSTVKTELEYHKMLEQKPNIEFLNSANIYEIKKDGSLELTEQKRLK